VYSVHVFKLHCCDIKLKPFCNKVPRWKLMSLFYPYVIYLPVMLSVMAFISLDSPSCEVPCWILLSVVYQDVTRQAKGLAYLSRCNSGWFCHTYTEHPIRVLDTKERSTRREAIRMFKIQWNHRTEEEATWETESYLQHNFPDFLQANLQT
jgi:hypothetical protein